jgi:hypothetical protein
MLLALILVGTVTVFLCWLLFALAGLALPVFAGAIVAHWAWQDGAGLIAAGLCGLFAAAATLFAGQVILATARSTSIRSAVLLLFAAPAAIAGFNAARGLAAIGTGSGIAQILLGLIGAVCVALAAISRLADPVAAEPDMRLAGHEPSAG